MSKTEAPPLTLEALTSGALAPWFGADDPVSGADKVATPKEAAARAVLAALNSTEGARGRIRILVTTAEDKRLVKNYLDAFLADVPVLKKMVRKVAQDGSVFLHGGVSIVIDTNEARLAKDSIATIILDATANEAIGHIWQDQDETPEEAAIRSGYAPEQLPRLMVIRWLKPGEQPSSPTPRPIVTEDGRVDYGPPDDAEQTVRGDVRRSEAGETPALPTPTPEDEARYREAVERLERDRINEKLAAGYRKMGGVA